MTVNVPGTSMTLGGRQWILPPLTLGAMEQLQDRLSAFQGSLTPASIGTVIDAAHASLKRNYPEITREEVADMVDMSNWVDVIQAVMNVSGIGERDPLSGEMPAASLTGETSTPI